MTEQTNNIRIVRVVKSKLCWNCGEVIPEDEVETGLRGGNFCCEGCYGEYWCEMDTTEGVE